MRGLVIVVALALGSPAAAQVGGPSGGVLLAPRAGWVVPIGGLGEVRSVATTATRPGDREVSLGSGATYGTAALFDVPGLPVQWRVDVDHAPSLAVRLGSELSRFDAAATFATAGVVTRPREGRLQPFVQAGVGFRALRFGSGTADVVEVPEGRVDLLGRFGGGLAVHVGPFALTTELSALTSTFRFDRLDGSDRTFQMDVAGQLGLRLRLF